MEVAREVYVKRLETARHNGLVKIITGMRRCGKSYLLFKLFYRSLISSGVDDAHIIRIDLEDRRNAALRQADRLLEHIDSKLQDQAMHYILLDEVQHVEEFADVLNSYLKMSNVDIYVTGSNSRFLSTDVATEFRGRGKEIHVMPLSFSEFSSVFKGTHEECLREYMTFGGLPTLISLKEDEARVSYLETLFQTTYLRDIVERYGVRNEQEIGELLNLIASSIGGLINPSKLHKTFSTVHKKTISRNTLDRYLGILRDVFLVSPAQRYNIKGRKYIGSPYKLYFTDLGLRNARLGFRQLEPPHLMENLIYNELIYRGFKVDVGILELHAKNADGISQRRQVEVDFVCNRGQLRCYIQVAWSLPTPEKWEQELRGLSAIPDEFPKLLITQDNVASHTNPQGIRILNLYDFLLKPEMLAV